MAAVLVDVDAQIEARDGVTGSPRLPLELVIIIIGHLAHKPAMGRCSLVCKDWMPFASRCLFQCLRYPACQRRGKPCEEEIGTGKSLLKCLERLKSSPRICAALQRLTLSGHRCAKDRNYKREPVSLRVLLEIIELAPRLDYLRMYACDFIPDIPLPDAPNRPNIRILIIRVFSDPDTAFYQRMLDFLVSFGHIENFLFDCHTGMPPGDGALAVPSPTHAARRLTFSRLILYLDSGGGEFILKTLNKITDVPSSLCRLILTGGLSSGIGSFLETVPERSELSMLSFSSNHETMLSRPYKISSRRIRISRVVNPHNPPSTPDITQPWTEIMHDLRFLASARIQELNILIFNVQVAQGRDRPAEDIYTEIEQQFIEQDWTLLEQVARGFPSLSALWIHVACDGYEKKLYDSLRNVTERTLSKSVRDKLRFGVSDDIHKDLKPWVPIMGSR